MMRHFEEAVKKIKAKEKENLGKRSQSRIIGDIDTHDGKFSKIRLLDSNEHQIAFDLIYFATWGNLCSGSWHSNATCIIGLLVYRKLKPAAAYLQNHRNQLEKCVPIV